MRRPCFAEATARDTVEGGGIRRLATALTCPACSFGSTRCATKAAATPAMAAIARPIAGWVVLTVVALNGLRYRGALAV